MGSLDALGRRFEDQYEARISPSARRYRRVKRATLAEVQQWYSTGITSYPYEHQVEDVHMVEITMPRDRLDDLLESQESYLNMREREEAALRQRYKALRNAWEQYQVVLAMVR